MFKSIITKVKDFFKAIGSFFSGLFGKKEVLALEHNKEVKPAPRQEITALEKKEFVAKLTAQLAKAITETSGLPIADRMNKIDAMDIGNFQDVDVNVRSAFYSVNRKVFDAVVLDAIKNAKGRRLLRSDKLSLATAAKGAIKKAFF